ncbi:hypothetical protein KP509_25G031300 [Ceratopteris richardii]|nr:hypothetical protein KP509_25G031300 [Ceratopteris richardii]
MRLDSGIYVPVTLLDAYTRFGNMEDVLCVFSSIEEKSVVAWNAVINGCLHHGNTDNALHFFLQMQTEGILPTHVTFVIVLKICSDIAFLIQGKVFHSQMLSCGVNSNVTVHNTLIDMYAKCTCLSDAQRVFDSSPNRDIVTFNAMIAGYVQHGAVSKALDVFYDMQQTGLEPNQNTFSSVLKACCSSTIFSEQGKLLHSTVVENGIETNLYIASTLINMYSKWQSVEDSTTVFINLPKPNLVTWSALVACYAQNDLALEAIDAFHKMQLEGLQPNQVVYASVLRACSDLEALDLGCLIHAQILEMGLLLNVFVASALIDMYTKCNSFPDARNVFDRFSNGNVVTWSAMIAGHAEDGRDSEALNLFSVMQEDGVDPNEITFIALLSLCTNITTVYQGMLIHTHIIEKGLEKDLPLSNSLVDMYANCGAFHDACKILEGSTQTNVVTWNALINGCVSHLDYEAVLNCLQTMLGQNLVPNDITFVSILSVCNQMGLMEEAFSHFSSMTSKYSILPRFEHYTCIIDILGRAGFFNEAEDILNTMPASADFVAVASLLSHCKTYQKTELAGQCFDGVVSFDSRSALGFMNMSSIYEFEGPKEYSDFAEGFRKTANAWKKPGMACFEADEGDHKFVVSDKTSERCDTLYTKLRSLVAVMREEGYFPQATFLFDHS